MYCTEHEILTRHKSYNNEYNMIFLVFELYDLAFILLINVKMPKNVGILTFMSMISPVRNLVEHKKSFIT